MIIESNFAADILEKIDRIIFSHFENDQIEFKHFQQKRNPNLEWVSKIQNYSLPIGTIGATDLLFITREYYEILVYDISIWDPDFVKSGHKETVDSTIESDYPDECIPAAIRDKIHKLIFDYDKVLSATKETNSLFGIEDEEKILKIHLNRYLEILNSDLLQIDFFLGITLTKEISDLILEIYIRFIHLRLSMLNPETSTLIPQSKGQSKKIIWNGTQRDLLELFIELQNKGWINEFEYGDAAKISNSICNLFDLTQTQKRKGSDVENSFYQILKGIRNPETKERDYTEILAPEDKRKFKSIKKCS